MTDTHDGGGGGPGGGDRRHRRQQLYLLVRVDRDLERPLLQERRPAVDRQCGAGRRGESHGHAVEVIALPRQVGRIAVDLEP